MQQSVRALDQQYLLQTTANLRKLQAENQQLKDLIRIAEANPGPHCTKINRCFCRPGFRTPGSWYIVAFNDSIADRARISRL
jgi:hypothetical protein